jgi:cation transport protein ChaC
MSPKKNVLTRDSILSGRIHELIKAENTSMELLTDQQRAASLQAMFNNGSIEEDVWLFGYGSLIWNPAIYFEEKRPMLIYGFHRKFCLKTYLGRGSKEAPGLVLGLDSGGSCKGVGFKIPAKTAYKELEVVWSREMVSGSYKPKWLSGKVGETPIKALGFVVDRRQDRYVNNLTEIEMAHLISKANGFLGSCSDYLLNTSEHLKKFGIPDKKLDSLVDLVNQLNP